MAYTTDQTDLSRNTRDGIMGKLLSGEWAQFFKVVISSIVVYLLFRFVFPLAWPFLLAFPTAMLLRKPVVFLKKYFHIRESLGAGLILLTAGAVMAFLFWRGTRYLLSEMDYLMKGLQEMIAGGFPFHLSGKWTVLGYDCTVFLQNALDGAASYFTWDRCIAYLMNHSTAIVEFAGGFFLLFFIWFLASILAVEEMEQLRQQFTMCTFYRQIVDFGLFFSEVCGKWLRAEGIIMLITIGISGIGLWISGFPHGLFKGIVIGVVDVLPILGAGTVYLPWIVWEFLNGRTVSGGILLILYGICYLTRQVLESKLVGKCMGMSAFEFLAAVYVGLKLFGGAGLVLGPVGILIIIWCVRQPWPFSESSEKQ